VLKEEEKRLSLLMQHPVDLDFNFNRNKKTKEYLKTLNLNGVVLPPKDFILDLKQLLSLIMIVLIMFVF
jgi:hypothetical protein